MKHIRPLALTVVMAAVTLGTVVSGQTGGTDATNTAAPSASNSSSRTEDRGFDYGWLGLIGLAGLLGLRRRDDRHVHTGTTRT